MDIALINSHVLSFTDGKLGIIENGGVGIKENKISFVGPMEYFHYQDADKILDANHHVTMPGFVNGHIHSGLTLLRGGAQDMPEIEWMNKGISPFAKHLTSEDQILGAKLGVLEGLSTGTTTFAEYTSHVADLVNEVYLPFGVRVVATETINEVTSERSHLKPTELYEFDRSKGEAALKRADKLFRTFENEDLVTCMYGPQALDMVSLDLLKSIRERAIERDCGMHMHVAQGRREQLQIQARYGKDATTIKVLEENELLGKFLLAAHIHGTSKTERERMVKNGVKMVSCQSSIGMIDGIVPPLTHYVQLGGSSGLGTDQAPGPGHHNMFKEMRTASIFGKVSHHDPTVLPAWGILRLATVGGAKVLGLEDKIGTLAEGKQADLITIDLNQLHLTPRVSYPFRNFIPNLVHSTTGREVDNVIINGEFIIEENEFVNIDARPIIKQANERGKNLFEQGAEEWRRADSYLVEKVDEGWF